MKFLVKTAATDGSVHSEVIDAPDKGVLYQKIREGGQHFISAVPVGEGRSIDAIVDKLVGGLFRGGVPLREKIVFSRNLAAMLNAGLSLSKCLSILERQTRNKAFKACINNMGNAISKGESFSGALGHYKNVFSSLFISMVRAGEESGKLSESLKIVGDQMEKNYLLSRRIKGAMIYPAVILSLMVGIGVLMMIYVVPTLSETFKELNVELPATTRLIIGVSDFLSHNTILFFLSLLVTGFGLYMLARLPAAQHIFERFILHVPAVGTISKEMNSARTARTLSSLLNSGVEVVSALSITADVIQNSQYRKVLAEAGEHIQKGKPISEVFLKYEHLYPVLVGEMMSVGEETGELSGMLSQLAEFYEGEVDQKTKDLSTIIEPFLMIIIGIGVGFFAISMMAPTYSLVDSIQ
jgi:type IV pilus assembly protein PilC